MKRHAMHTHATTPINTDIAHSPIRSSPVLTDVSPLAQLPHLLQVLDDRHIRIHVPIHAVHHARLFRAVEFAG